MVPQDRNQVQESISLDRVASSTLCFVMGQLGSRYPTCIGAGLHKGFGDNGVGDVGPSHEGLSPHQSFEVAPDLTLGRRGLGTFELSFGWPWPDPKVTTLSEVHCSTLPFCSST